MPSDNINAGFGLPLEYQSQLESLAQRRKLAEALQLQAARPIEVPQYGPMASKLSPLAPLGQALAMYLNQKNITSANTERTKVLGQADEEGRQEMGMVTGMSDPQAQIAAALSSRFPGVRAYGAGLQKSRDSRVEKAGAAIMDRDPTTGMGLLQSGMFPAGQYTPPPPKPPSFGDHQGSSYALQEQPGGKVDFRWAPKATTVNTNVNTRLPGKEAEMEFERESKELGDFKTRAQNAQTEWANAQRLVEVLEQGARTGGGQTAIQAVRKFGQAFGVDMPETGVTESAAQLLGDRIIGRAKELGHNPSNADVQFIKAASGSLDTDPSAITRLLSYWAALNLKTLQDYGTFVETKRQTGTGSTMYSTADVGVRTPEALFGPMDLQMRIAQELQRLGGDLGTLRDPEGQSMAGARFRLGPAAPIAPTAPPGVVIKPPPGRRAQ